MRYPALMGQSLDFSSTHSTPVQSHWLPLIFPSGNIIIWKVVVIFIIVFSIFRLFYTSETAAWFFLKDANIKLALNGWNQFQK
jgi:hypothetical protein